MENGCELLSDFSSFKTVITTAYERFPCDDGL